MDKNIINSLRREFMSGSLLESELPDDPLILFREKFQQAIEAVKDDANAMVLSTVSVTGQPRSRVVLLKSLDEGFVFATNYLSQKGSDLAVNPKASLLFYWTELQVQVRIEGMAHKVGRSESDVIFKDRPLESQLGAMASVQSEVIPSRQFLEDKFAEMQTRYLSTSLSCPDWWGAYRLVPESIEFWQGRENRLHDRIRYRMVGSVWLHERLSP